MVKLVVENDPKEIARREALDQLERVLRSLFANLLRVSRGAGKAYDVGPDCVAVVQAYTAYRDAVGCYPASHEISKALNFRTDKFAEDVDHSEDDMRLAIERIIAGSFQLVASEFLHQRTQASIGESQLFDGVSEVEACRERVRQKFQEQLRKQQPQKRTSKRKPRKPKPEPEF